jgi:ATP-dependent RNA helicase DeaD
MESGNEKKKTERDNTESRILEPEDSLPEITLEELPQELKEACARAGWDRLMPVQTRTIPYLLARRDLMIQSRTGSGKTGAFVLPILQRVDPGKNQCQALVLTPTRELAKQVTAEAELLAGDTGMRIVSVYGGVSYGPQLEGFRKGAHLVVGTPGRILDHLIRKSLRLKNLDILVFDEADRLMSMGFYPDMKEIQSYFPERRINAYMFSATFPSYVMSLAGEFLQQPDFLSLSRDQVHVTETEHAYYLVPPMEKDRALVRIIEVENPPSGIIFCNTRSETHYVTVVLQRFGYDADELSADLNQNQREKVMDRLRKGTLRFLVATDVAARGIDIHELSHVILYDVPEDPESYIHRVGRTGRMGASGEAISLVTQAGKMELDRIARIFDIEITQRPLPTDEDVQELVSERITAMLEARLRSRDKLKSERMKRFVPLGKNLAQIDDESALIAMLLDDFYQETLHGKPPQPALPRAAKRTTKKPGTRTEPARGGRRQRRGGRQRRPKERR